MLGAAAQWGAEGGCRQRALLPPVALSPLKQRGKMIGTVHACAA